jgi:hypothetical protein
MRLTHIEWNPTDRQLRQFGIACLIAFPFLAWLWAGNTRWTWLGLGIGFACFIIGTCIPRALRPLFLLLSLLAAPMGLIVGEIFLLIAYFVVMLPIGLIFRLRGRDALQRDVGIAKDSYWQAKKPPGAISSYFRQF